MVLYDEKFSPLYDYALTIIHDFPNDAFYYCIWQEWNDSLNKMIWVLEIHEEEK